MSWVDAVADLLDACHSLLIKDLDVGLSTGNDESPAIAGVVDCMILVILVEHDVLDLVAEVGRPAQDAAIEASTKESLLVHGLVAGWLPGQARDWHIHFLILDLVKAVTKHG